MNIKQFFTKNWIHFVAILVMIILTVGYFSIQFDGYELKQHDIEQFTGAAHEIQDFREKTGEEPLWTNSMFGGMPALQISMVYGGNFIMECFNSYWRFLPPPAGPTLIYMLGFYVLMLCLRINPWVGLIGAVAFGFSSYDIIIIQAGHNSKAFAAGFMAPVIGGFLLAYQRNMKWGIILSALFMTLEMSMNHLQVTYYLVILLLGLGIVMLLEAIRKGTIKNFIFATLGILGAYGLALFINYGNITMTYDYSKQSIRGANDLTLNSDGTSNHANSTTGLDKDYVTQYSNGLAETFTLVSPYIKGSAPGAFGGTHFAEQYLDPETGNIMIDPQTGKVVNSDLSGDEMKDVMNGSASYWGDQPQVSGPVYVGVIVIFLAILGLVFLKTPVKWALLAVTILALALSWGKNFMGLTDFFLDHVPGYNKFRAPTIIMVIVELCIPLIGVLFLNKLVKEREQLKARKKAFLITFISMLVFLVGLKTIGLGDGYLSSAEKTQMSGIKENMRSQIMAMTPEQLAQYQLDPSNQEQINEFIDLNAQGAEKRYANVKEIRETIFHSSMNRSILFLVLAAGVLAIMFYTKVPKEIVLAGLFLLIAVDMISVARNYLGGQKTGDNYKYWDLKANVLYPIVENPEVDSKILENEITGNPALAKKVEEGARFGRNKAEELGFSGAEKRRVESAYKFSALNMNTNYRVFDLDASFNSANASYFHKSLGGYHGAKLRNIQNLFEYHLIQMNNKVFNMMNVKYFIQGGKVRPNPDAMGNAWFVRKIDTFDNPDTEIRALGSKFDVKNSGVGTLLVNNEPKTEASVYGSESLKYVLEKDTMDVRLQNGMPEGLSADFVMDINGKTNWVVGQTLANDTAKSFLRLVHITVADEFKPLEEAVMLKSEAKKLSSLQFSGEGSIKMTSYAPNKITYTSNSNAKQFAVFSEVYYSDGWKATIDGKEVEITKTNYLLRGLEVPAGNHKIEFSFRLAKFDKANNFARIGGIVIVLLIIGGIVTDVMKKRKAVKN